METGSHLEELREKINGIDRHLVSLFESRMEVVSKVLEYKENHGMPVLDSKREKEVIRRTVSYLKDKALGNYLCILMDELMTLSRQYQIDRMNSRTSHLQDNPECKPIPASVVGHYGAPGSFSEEAAIEYFGEGLSRKGYVTFDGVIQALLNQEIDMGVLPVENSSTGTISEVVDLIRDNQVFITGEHIVPIRHNLLALPGARLSDIKTVYSHYQGFEQSSLFLKQYAWEQIVYKSTADSAERVRELGDKTKAAIASSRCAASYGLDILVPDINFNRHNYTRFIIIGVKMEVGQDCNKMSVVMGISHKPGALYSVLRLFNERNINIMKIESRPVIGKPWEYLFFFDFEGNLMEDRVKSLVEYLKNTGNQFRLLGNYRQFVTQPVL